MGNGEVLFAAWLAIVVMRICSAFLLVVVGL